MGVRGLAILYKLRMNFVVHGLFGTGIVFNIQHSYQGESTMKHKKMSKIRGGTNEWLMISYIRQ